MQDENELDDVDAWLYNTVECSCARSSRSRLSSTHPTSPSQSPSRIFEKPHKDEEPLLTHSDSTTATFPDPHEILANGQNLLQEWNRRWGSNFFYRAANGFLGIGLEKLPQDRTRREIQDVARKGRRALSQLESIASIDFRSIKDFPVFWIETLRVIEGLTERVTQADVVLEKCQRCPSLDSSHSTE